MNPPGWTADEPCPICGSWDITEWDFYVAAVVTRMAWECRDCGHLVQFAPPRIAEGGETA
jgi:rubrerythrin